MHTYRETLYSLAVLHWEIDIEKVIYFFAVKKQKRRSGFLLAIGDAIDDENCLR